MEIQNVSEHLRCYNYDSGERPAFEVRTITKNSAWEFHAGQHKFIFLLEGMVEAKVGVLEKKELTKGLFWFITSGQQVLIRASTNALVLVMRFSNRITFCDCYILEQLYNECRGMDEVINERQLYPGIIRPSLWYCIKGLYNTTFDGLRCRSFFDIKIKEVCFLLRTYYPKRELFRIFYPILTADIAFSDHVKSSWQKYPTVDKLAHALNYTSSGFYKRFTSVFGSSPHDWITEKKRLSVYNDLISSYLPLQEVAIKWGFSGLPSLSKWCVKHLGDAPGRIRRTKLHGRKE
jgi:AraC-like DNA-binding protein